MSSAGIIGLIVMAVIVVVGVSVKLYTARKVDDLDGFGGIIDKDKIEDGQGGGKDTGDHRSEK